MAVNHSELDNDHFPDPNDPTLFPRLSERQFATISRFSRKQTYAKGETIFEHGQREAPFLVLTSGTVEFFDKTLNDPRPFAVARAGTFIGDIAIFTGEATVAECVASEPTEALAMNRESLRLLVAEFTDIGDTILQTMVARRAWLEGHGYGLLQLIGPARCSCTFELRNFLSKNLVPFQWIDTDSDATSAQVITQLRIDSDELPVLIGAHGVYRNPEISKVARCLGLRPEIQDELYDLVVVGCGPAGLAAAVYASSEGLKTVVLDSEAPGGQAGESSRIDNYLGFATGVSGQELTRQAVLQVRKFGAILSSPTSVESIECRGSEKILTLDDGEKIRSRAVIVASGARYRTLQARGCEKYLGTYVYYAAGHLEARLCRGKEVVVVGGGNSAGQAAMFLAEHVKKVTLVVRRGSLQETMSQYLISRISREPNIEVLTNAEVTELSGGDLLENVQVRTKTGIMTCPSALLFIMIGAEPHTQWLTGCCDLDDKGFVITGTVDAESPSFGNWKLERKPYLLETSRPGVFAVGDVRSGSAKRVASAVGEGAMAVKLVHEYLSTVPS